MAEGKEKSLEMRIAAIEDRLEKMQISEEDMRTYQRVAAQLGSGSAAQLGSVAYEPMECGVNECQQINRMRGTPIYRMRHRFVPECYECQPCWPGGGFGGFGGGFGGLGT